MSADLASPFDVSNTAFVGDRLQAFAPLNAYGAGGVSGWDGLRNALATPNPNSYEEKLRRAKEALGDRWVFHPAYKGDPRHSVFNRCEVQILTPPRNPLL